MLNNAVFSFAGKKKCKANGALYLVYVMLIIVMTTILLMYK